MSKVRVAAFSVSLDGYGAGPGQNLENPLGRGGEELHGWFIPTRTFQRLHGKSGGTAGVDNDFAARGFENVGAWIMGRNMFGPVRGEWPDHDWKGWWGEEPPYRAPVFVLTHYPRGPVEMKGGTTFHFVDDGIEAALARALEVSGEKDVMVMGGAATIREYLQARLINEVHFVISPILLGSGESLFAGLDLPALGYQVAEHVPGENGTHVVLSR